MRIFVRIGVLGEEVHHTDIEMRMEIPFSRRADPSRLRHILCNATPRHLTEVTEMENDFSSMDSTLGQSGAASSSSAAGSGNTGTTGNTANTSNTGNTGSADAASSSGTSGSSDQRFADRARDLAGTAQGKLADMGSAVRERAGTMKDSLADALETGADKLRTRGSQTSTDGTLAAATTAGSVATGDGRVAQVTDRVATGMDKTADWLRDADLDGLRTSIETQVKEHPGRTLLIAAGLGYLLGKALRK
jgi:hypothetical protein